MLPSQEIKPGPATLFRYFSKVLPKSIYLLDIDPEGDGGYPALPDVTR
jgi:hypothetical protein